MCYASKSFAIGKQTLMSHCLQPATPYPWDTRLFEFLGQDYNNVGNICTLFRTVGNREWTAKVCDYCLSFGVQKLSYFDTKVTYNA